MSQVTQALIAALNDESGARSGSSVRQNAPVLITEQQLALSTAAAVSARSPRRRWLYATLVARLGRSRTALMQPRPHGPRLEPAYFESARMSRAMERL
jgi:hypothetical protein